MFHWLDASYPGNNQQLAANQVAELDKAKHQKYLYVYRTDKGIELGLAPTPAMNMYNITIIGKIKLEDV